MALLREMPRQTPKQQEPAAPPQKHEAGSEFYQNLQGIQLEVPQEGGGALMMDATSPKFQPPFQKLQQAEWALTSLQLMKDQYASDPGNPGLIPLKSLMRAVEDEITRLREAAN